MKIDVINACCDLGVDVDGASNGPLKLKERIKNNKNIDKMVDLLCDCENKSLDPRDLEKNYDRLMKYTTDLYLGILRSKNDRSFTITVGGDHSVSASSALASIKKEENLGVIWIDSHADYNTFKTTITGNLHGLPLATINGLNRKISLFHDGDYVKPEYTVIIGYRSEEINKKDELNNLKTAGVTFYTTEDLKEKGIKNVMKEAFDIASNNGEQKVHVSYDLDFIDPKDAPGVSVPEQNGVKKKDAFNVLDCVLKNIKQVSSFDLVEFNPNNDIDDKTLNIAEEIINRVCETIKESN